MEKKKILVIGGAGYIGSHFTLKAVEKGFIPTVMDNFSQGHRSAVRDARLFEADLLDRKAFRSIFQRTGTSAFFILQPIVLSGNRLPIRRSTTATMWWQRSTCWKQ